MTADVEQTRKGGPAPENEAGGSYAPASDPINAYIAGIGELTRGLRAERGMSRKDLSRHSGISERYMSLIHRDEASSSAGTITATGRWNDDPRHLFAGNRVNRNIQGFVPVDALLAGS